MKDEAAVRVSLRRGGNDGHQLARQRKPMFDPSDHQTRTCHRSAFVKNNENIMGVMRTPLSQPVMILQRACWLAVILVTSFWIRTTLAMSTSSADPPVRSFATLRIQGPDSNGIVAAFAQTLYGTLV